MKRKILTFIVNKGKFLALYSKPHPDHGEGGWFVVTESIEENESPEEAVAREVLEETRLNTEEIIPLNWGSIYEWRGELCEEQNFITFVKLGEVILNEEHSNYEWLNLDDFIKKINWDDDKELLKKVLEKAIKKEKHFDKMCVKDYRKEGKK